MKIPTPLAHRNVWAGWRLLAAGLLSGCTVYAPMQPTVSTIRQAGQAQVSTSVQLSGRVEAGAVYSPLPHVLVAGAGTYRPALGGTTYFGTRQWEAGAGTYWPLGHSWRLTGLGGYGYAATERVSAELFGHTPQLRACYGKLFGQLGFDHSRREGMSVGVVYRFTQLHFDELSFYSPYYEGVVDIARMNRHELLLYGRRELGWGQAHRWQFQATTGVSFSGLAPPANDNQPNSFETNRNYKPVLLLSAGLVFTPAWGQAAGPTP